MKRIISIMLAVLMIFSVLSVTASAATTTVIDHKLGDIIAFGSYPQSRVTKSSLLAELNKMSLKWKSYGYYNRKPNSQNTEDGYYDSIQFMIQGDWMKYADVTYNGAKYRCVYFTKYRPIYTAYGSSTVGSNQDDNGYDINTKYWFKFEPIKWRVLDPSDGLIMSEDVIDAQAFSNLIYSIGAAYYNDTKSTNYSNDYATSSIRAWLNDDFYNTAFTSSEKSYIKTSTLDNKAYTGYEKYGSEPTNDKVFLPSYYELINSAYGFSAKASKEDAARITVGSDYAKCQGLSLSTFGKYKGYSGYWTRTAADNGFGDACTVSCDGKIYYYTDTVNYTAEGVRPALRLNLSSLPHTHCYISEVTKSATKSTDGTMKYTCACSKTYTKVTAKIDTVKLSKTSYNYDGKAKKPTVKVKDINGKSLKEGTDYKVTYESGRKKMGTYTVTVKFKGSYSGTKTLKFKIVKPAKPSKFTATQSTSSVKLTWSKVAGAKGYRVYQYDKKADKYVKLTDTTKTTYTVKNLKAGTKYKFAVRAHSKSEGKTLWGDKKVLTTATKTKAPTLKAKAGCQKATLSWNKISGATGYVVYMATSKNGEFKKVTTIKKAEKIKYTQTGLTKCKTCYFKVRAYKTAGGKNIYSAYSDIVKVKVK